jgi:hypothetical protein
MPIPLITPEILASATPVAPGWNYLEFVKVRQQEDNPANYFYDFTVLDGPADSHENKGKKATNFISMNAINSGVADATASWLGMLSALTGLDGKDLVGKVIDENALVGRKLWALIKQEVYQNRPQLKFVAFSPDGSVPF